ncbi:MAG: DUF1338 domain-containing protein, partial [Planctomycetes bacterium]|nr:DUF1338 domain-containing protein [Planctomycetota bacterium]
MSRNEKTNLDEAAGPHGRVPLSGARERFIAKLFDRLWDQYRERVSYVRDYEQVIASAGATFVNDHIAFRTLAGRNPLTGIAVLSHIFDALGYRTADCYHFETKHLTARHFQHPNSRFPKLFISELKTWELSRSTQEICAKLLQTHRRLISLETLAALSRLDDDDSGDRESLLETVLAVFQCLPWEIPEKRDVLALNEESQYAAWVAVHGYAVNHFTSLINSHGVDALDNIEKTAAALSAAGVPMKADIEGSAGSKLRQTATQAGVIDV